MTMKNAATLIVTVGIGAGSGSLLGWLGSCTGGG